LSGDGSVVYHTVVDANPTVTLGPGDALRLNVQSQSGGSGGTHTLDKLRIKTTAPIYFSGQNNYTMAVSLVEIYQNTTIVGMGALAGASAVAPTASRTILGDVRQIGGDYSITVPWQPVSTSTTLPTNIFAGNGEVIFSGPGSDYTGGTLITGGGIVPGLGG